MLTKLYRYFFPQSPLEQAVSTSVGEEEIKLTLLKSKCKLSYLRLCKDITKLELYIKKTVPKGQICFFYEIEELPLTHVFVKCGTTVSEVLIQGGHDFITDEVTRMLFRLLDKENEANKEKLAK